MKIGIWLPASLPGVNGRLILEWARRADAGPFSTLGVNDRLVYRNFEPLVTLAAAAAVTQRIRLMTIILIAPLRTAGVLAKQTASLDSLCGGRLSLGLAVGPREDDFRAAPAPFKGRGRRFEEQLATMKRIWSGEPLGLDIGPVGPRPVQPGGPEVLIGGSSPAVVRRVARWGDGYIGSAGGDPVRASQLYSMIEEAWRAEGRSGRPRFVAGLDCVLGAEAVDRAVAYIDDFYALQPIMKERATKELATSPTAIRKFVRAFEAVGLDELILRPLVPDLDQVDRLADVVG